MFKNKYEAEITELRAQIERFELVLLNTIAQPRLANIEVIGRKNVFTFLRGDKVYKVETYSTLADNVPEWKRTLL